MSESDCSGFVAFVKGLFEDVATATGYRYDAKDNQNRGLDTIKIIENPVGGYLGVYHSLIGGNFQVRLANSTDLLHWTFIRTIEPVASQPTIAQARNDAYIVVFEKEDVSSHLKLHYYSNLSTLINGSPNFTVDIPRNLSSFHEGTPNVYNITIKDSVMNACIGFHYDGGSTDNAAVGWLTVPLDNPENWEWNATRQTEYNQKLREHWNVKGNIGDRDYGQIFGRNFTLQEANLLSREEENINRTRYWASWRTFLYGHLTNNFTMLNIQTHKGSTSFGNPTVTRLKSPNGKNAIVVTYFLFSEGAKIGEAGQLIFYKEFIVVPDDYPTIQEAINAANEGDTVFVCNGTYSENVVVNKTVSLIGEDKETVIINGKGGSMVITILANNVTLTGFAIRNGWYAGVYVYGHNATKITENIVSFNIGTYTGIGYGIYIVNSDGNIIRHNIISNNTEDGLKFDSNATNNLITENTIVLNGGTGVYMYDHADRNIISANNISFNGLHGIHIAKFSNSQIIAGNNIMANNNTGIFIDSFLGDCSNNIISGNNITANNYGIRLYSSNSNTVFENNVINNDFGLQLFPSSNNNMVIKNNWASLWVL